MEPILRTTKLGKSFGHFAANIDIDFAVQPGELRAVIGPNGAGKTTFFNLLSGALPPSEGRIFFRDRDVTALEPYQRARLGIARSFQITNIFGRLS
ncbi:MAG: ATP-binding cassette domain-containing protein, partial [Vulcanimicrobiaceae bacterium]